jgi:RNA polymerase sigma-70 factor (ECF subfamily)
MDVASEPDSGPSDRDLLARAASGDEGALRALYEEHAAWLHARLRRRCSDREVVADVLQDTFVAAWRGANRFRGDGDVAAWLWGIAVRRLVSRRRRRTWAVGPALLDRDAVDVAAEEQVLLAVEYADLGSALAKVSPELRTVLQATVLDGLSTREAATLLGIPEGTVKTRLHRARVRLREELS